MNRTDDILEKLKNTEQPEMDLTEEIMNSLPAPLPSSPRGGKEAGRTLIFVRAVLSVASMWIVGFFLYLQYEASPRGGMEGVISRGGREEASTLKEVYKYRLCQDCKKTISYTQIKSMLYENK